MSVNLEPYRNLNYQVHLRPLSEEDGGGWFAEIPELKGCCSDGATPEEALRNIQDAKISWIKTALKRGQKIPLPAAGEQEDYSGKFTLRLPKSLHRELALAAEKDNISLNQYILSLLSLNFGKTFRETGKKAPVEQHIHIYIPELSANFKKISYALTDRISESTSGLWSIATQGGIENGCPKNEKYQ